MKQTFFFLKMHTLVKGQHTREGRDSHMMKNLCSIYRKPGPTNQEEKYRQRSR